MEIWSQRTSSCSKVWAQPVSARVTVEDYRNSLRMRRTRYFPSTANTTGDGSSWSSIFTSGSHTSHTGSDGTLTVLIWHTATKTTNTVALQPTEKEQPHSCWSEQQLPFSPSPDYAKHEHVATALCLLAFWPGGVRKETCRYPVRFLAPLITLLQYDAPLSALGCPFSLRFSSHLCVEYFFKHVSFLIHRSLWSQNNLKWLKWLVIKLEIVCVEHGQCKKNGRRAKQFLYVSKYTKQFITSCWDGEERLQSLLDLLKAEP